MEQRLGRVLIAPILAIALLVPWAGPAHADQNDDLERLHSAVISSTMLTDAVIDLGGQRATSSVFDLSTDGTVIGLETTKKSDGKAVVTLTSDLLFEFGKAALTPNSTAAIPNVARGIA